MAGDWIKVENTTPDKPEVFQIAEQLGIDPDAVTGKLIRIWIWADEQAVEGNVVGVTKTLLDRVAAATGFADAMLHVGWLAQNDQGLIFPRFGIHNGDGAKKRAQTNRRVAKHRKKQGLGSGDDESKLGADCNAPSVSKSVTRDREEIEIEINKKKKNSSSGNLSEFAVDRFTPPPDLERYCQSLELDSPLEQISAEFRRYNADCGAVGNAEWWCNRYRWFVEKRQLPPRLQQTEKTFTGTNATGGVIHHGAKSGRRSVNGSQSTRDRPIADDLTDTSWADQPRPH